MSQRPIMDAGPGLNFFSVNKERLLFAAIGALAVPETVVSEIRRKSRKDQRFAAAERVMARLPHKLFEVLTDDVTDELAAAVQLITGTEMRQRIHSSKDLGEIMVIAHAVVAAKAGKPVLILMDDEYGRKMATIQARRLEALREAGKPVGSIHLVSTVSVLKKAAGSPHLPDRNAMRELYIRLRALDDGLMPLETTELLSLPCWSSSKSKQ